jgi:hypothetical protein
MCKNCYHKKGREKNASKCEHKDKPLYAFGICKQCYQLNYSKKREKKKVKMNEIENENEANQHLKDDQNLTNSKNII